MRIAPFAVITLIFSCLVALPMGCTTWRSSAPDSEDYARLDGQLHEQALELIAIDFVKALEQMPPLLPAQTTIHMLRSFDTDAFTSRVQHALQRAGYAVRWVEDGVGEHLFQYRHEQEASDSQTRRDLYEVAVGRIELRRSYLTDAQASITPVTPLYVRGTDASHVMLDDSLFQPTALHTKAIGQRSVAQPAPLPPAVSRLNALSVPADANPLDTRIAGSASGQSLRLPLVALPKVENVFELGGSNYQQALAEYSMVRRQVLTFPNDSLRLGDVNKQLIAQLVSDFEPGSDIFSVLGCSLGPTQLKGGNAALALGRASRVREALLFAGVDEEKILDEGCWAGDSPASSLPRRGVVITLNRRG